MNKTLVLMLALGLAMPLAACRSRAKNCCAQPVNPCDPCAPGTYPGGTYAPQAAPAPGPIGYYDSTPAPAPAPIDDYTDTPSQDEFNNIAVDLEEARARNLDAERVLNEQERALAELREANRRLERELDTLGTAPVAAPTGRSGAAGSGRCSTLAQDLREMGGLEVIEDRDTVVVRVTDAFRSGSEKLKSDARLVSALRDAATAIKLYPGASVSVIGHSDTQPISKSGWPNNTALSLARAQTVRGVLADNGVQTSRMSVDGRGEMEPLVSPEQSRADQARNRRVEIRIQF